MMPLWQWLVIGACMTLLYSPTFHALATGYWTTDQNAHGPIVLAVSAWYFWFRSKNTGLAKTHQNTGNPVAGWTLFVLGLLMYAIGQSQGFLLFSAGSLIPVTLGLTLIFFGSIVARRLWFGYFFLFFSIPLPGAVIDTLTHPMKMAVSWSAEHLLWYAQYPISRAGVVLNLGGYQLLVADACAGLNSLFTLEALGLMYMNIRRHESALRNTALALLIVPISFTANVIRVIVLCLITFHMGDEAGQGFLHSFSGMVLFLSALFLVISTDEALRRIAQRSRP